MSRLPILTDSQLDAAQKRLYEIITSGPRGQKPRAFPLTDARGGLQGPFNALLYSPEIGDTVQQLGARLRFESTLPGHIRELAILAAAQHWRADYEWHAHAPIAAREGLSEETIAAVKAGRPPEDSEELGFIHRFVTELLVKTRVREETYNAVLEQLGTRGAVELVLLVGYYTLLACALNAFEIPVPEGGEAPFSG